MSNIKITIEGVEKEYRECATCKRKAGDFELFGTWYGNIEPVKDYEILSFLNVGDIYNKLEDGKFIAACSTCSHTIERMLEAVKIGGTSIESVKRLSDGEVFSVGEDEHNVGKISKIVINKIGKIAIYNLEGDGVSLSLAVKVKQPTILLKTEDGVKVTDGEQVIFGVNKVWEEFKFKASCKYPAIIYFSTEEAMDEYILQNKPVTVTLAEWMSSPIMSTRDFFKSKQK